MICDYLLFWHRHNQKPTLSGSEMLLFCSRTHGDSVTLDGVYLRRKLRRRQ